MTDPPVLGVVAPEFAQTVENALRKRGDASLANQITDLPIVVRCNCAPLCSAFLSVPLDERSGRKASTSFLLANSEMIVLVDTIGDVVVGLDVLDSGELRTAVDNFAKPS